MTTDTLTFGSLFAGIGGFDRGFERAGMACRWQVEIDKQCQQVLARHWPDVPKYEDVKNVRRKQLEPVDVICGGFPCQDVSVAGRREGLAGERSGLWFEFLRVITELEPEWVIIENVPGLLSSNGGGDFATILRGLAQCGYWWAYRILDAQFFGVPQRRRRVFIVASLTRGRPQEILFERESSPWDIAPGREAGERVTQSLTGSPHSSSAGNPDDNRAQGNFLIPDVALARNAHGGNRYDFESETFVLGFDKSRSTVSGEVARPLRVNGGQSPGVNDGKADNQCVAFAERSRQDGRNLETQDELAYAITDMGSGGQPHSSRIAGNFGVRRLTPTECERLQGFPDDWTDGQSDSARYRQLGNAVAVPVTEWIGKRIMEVTHA